MRTYYTLLSIVYTAKKENEIKYLILKWQIEENEETETQTDTKTNDNSSTTIIIIIVVICVVALIVSLVAYIYHIKNKRSEKYEEA